MKKYKCNIVTLNHDLLLDKFFLKEKIDYCDGFEVSLEDKAKIFNPICFSDINKPHLIKLHGSIDWEEYKEGGQDLVARRLNGFEERKFADSYGPTDEIVILAGTHNKLEGYSYGIYADLIAEYTRLLRATDYVIICGYGFGDRGINSRLANWLGFDCKNQILVIHHIIEDLKKNLEHHAAQLLNLIDPKRIHFMEEQFEGIKWDEVKSYVNG